ncbi:reverse transcriptase domain-containing protein [Tanacetum coccineum]
MHLNLTKPQWAATGFKFKHDYTVIDSPRAVTFRDRYGVQMIMRFNEIHKFSDGTLQQIDEALDYRVKEFRVNRTNPGMNTRFWTKKDVVRSKEFMFAIQKRLKTRRIFRNLESFVGGWIREGDYRSYKDGKVRDKGIVRTEIRASTGINPRDDPILNGIQITEFILGVVSDESTAHRSVLNGSGGSRYVGMEQREKMHYNAQFPLFAVRKLLVADDFNESHDLTSLKGPNLEGSLHPVNASMTDASPRYEIDRRQAAEISQSQFPTQTQVADDATFTSVDVDAGGAATTDISLDAGQGSGTIHKTPTRLNDAPLSGVNTPGSAEGSLSQTELMDFVLKLAKKVEGLETELKNTKQIYGKVYTKLVQRVKSLEDQLKTEKSKFTKRKFQIVISEDEADLPAEDSSKQGRMIEDIDLDVDTSLVQPHAAEDFHFVTPTKIRASGEAHSLDISPEDQLGVLSAAKILADAGRSKTVSEVQTYIRRRRDVNTGSEGVNTAGDTANVMHQNVNILIPSSSLKDKDPGQREGKAVMEVDEIQKKFKKGEYKQISHDEEVAQKLHAEELAKDKARQEQEKYDLEKALELQKQLDERKEVVVEEAYDIDWSDPSVLRYHALQNRSFSVAEDSEIEKEVMKRPGFDLQQESIKKNEKIEASGFVQKQPAGEEKEKKKDAESSKQVEEEIVQQEDVVAEQVVKESSKKAGGRLKRKSDKYRSQELIEWDTPIDSYGVTLDVGDFERDDPHSCIRWFNKITSTLKYKNVPHEAIKLMLFPFSLEGAARIWLEKEPPCSIHAWEYLVSKFVNYFFPPSKTTNLKNDITNFQQWFDETFSEAWGRFKDLLRKCPRHIFSELHQIDTFYNALTQFDQNSLNAATGGNFLNRTPRDALTIIENKSKVRTSRNKLVVSKASATTSSSASAYLPEITALTNVVKAMLLQNKTPSPAPVKAIEEICVTCGGPRLTMSVLLPRATLLMLLQLQGPTIKEVSDTVLKEKLIIVLAIK